MGVIERRKAGTVVLDRDSLEEVIAEGMYTIRIDWTSSEPFDPENEMIDVVLTTRDGREYWANFTTLRFINNIFEKNKRTRELLAGTYFGMPDNLIILERLSIKYIRATIEGLIKNKEIGCYFKRVSHE